MLECLEAFLPTDLPPELYERGWKLWLPQLSSLLTLMENSGAWEMVGRGGQGGGRALSDGTGGASRPGLGF